MTTFEMRNFDAPYDPDDTEMSAQERLLFNNNYNSNHSHPHPMLEHPHHNNGGLNNLNGGGGVQDENHYQIPYAHLHQHQYLQHAHQHPQQQPLQYHHLQPQGMYNSDDLLHTLNPTHSLNGGGSSNGSNGNCVVGGGGGYRDKYSVAYPVRQEDTWRTNRSNGSGVVYRPRKKVWWFAMLLILLLIIIAGAVVIAVYFTVLKKEPQAQPVPAVSDQGDTASNSGSGGSDINNNRAGPSDRGSSRNDDDNKNSDNAIDVNRVTGQRNNPDVVYSTREPPGRPDLGHSATPGMPQIIDVSDLDVKKFDAYWHPGDSRLFTAIFTDGPEIQAFGPKKSDGTAKSLYSLSITDTDGVTKSIRFLGQLNLASVILPNGIIVHYDWSANMADMEVKIFQPHTEFVQGPISHIALVDVGVRSYLLRQIHKAMADAKNRRSMHTSGTRRGSTKCFSRFPVMVSKCGGQYPYDGAFVQGEITGIDKPMTMSALPWPKDHDDHDPCYTQNTGTASNYYLPLPGHVDNDNATMIKDAYAASSASLFADLCNVMNNQVNKERHDLCSDLANKVMKVLNRQQLLHIVYESCSTILNALHVACAAINNISSADENPTLTENGLLGSLSKRLSNSFPPGLPNTVDLKAHAFCPSSLPLSSYQSTVSINTIRGNVVEDAIHINCPDYPEVRHISLDHLLTQQSSSSSGNFNLVKHKMRVCSICAFEKEVSAQVVSDEMLCNNTCKKNNGVLEQIPDYYPKEEHTFVDQDSVYCHGFLTTVDNQMEPIGRECLGHCMSHLHVQFRIKDPKTNTLYYDQTVQCSELRRHACKMKLGR